MDLRCLTALLVLSLLLFTAKCTGTAIECADMLEEDTCQDICKASNQCGEAPCNYQCRKTCGSCNECFDAENMMTCEDIKSRGECNTLAGAAKCTETCGVWACQQQVRRVFHMS